MPRAFLDSEDWECKWVGFDTEKPEARLYKRFIWKKMTMYDQF